MRGGEGVVRGMSCPWCGRVIVLRKNGTVPVHKSNEFTLTGRTRLHCRSDGKNPDDLTREQRNELMKHWRDDDGWLRYPYGVKS